MPKPDDTAELIYEHTRSGPTRQVAAADALDSKAFQLLSAATVVLGLGAFSRTQHGGTATHLYEAGIASYALAALTAWQIVRVRGFWVVDAADRWWPSHAEADVSLVRGQLLNDLAAAAAYNRAVLRQKAQPLRRLLWFVALEAVLVSIAVIYRTLA